MFNYPTLFDSIVKELGTSYTHTNYKDDIIELDEKFLVELELPGFQKNDLDISVKKDSLIVSAKREEKESEGRYITRGRFHDEFKKVYRLGDEIDTEKIEATLVDGILTLTLPKGGAAKPKKIEIG